MARSTPTSGRSVFLGGLALITAYLLGVGVITVVAVAVHHDRTAVETAAKSTTVAVQLSEFKIAGNLTAPAGDVKLAVTNAGTMDHNLTVGDGSKKTAMLSPGTSQTIDLGVMPAGSVQVFCSVPGHKESGMSATLTVTAAASSAASAASGDMAGMDMSGSSGSSSASGSSQPDYAKMDADMVASFKAFPAKTKGVGNQILQPTVLPDGTKQFELTAEIAKWEVEPGRIVDAWTYNGMVPGPMFKLNVGDHIRVLFHNHLPVSQDIHWHGIETPFDMDGVAPITQNPVKPGGDFTYDFTVDRPYMGMYHPHMHGETAIPNGMWGVIQVGDTPIAKGVTVDGIAVPPDVKPAVDMPMVLNDAGVIGFSLNGKRFPATAPIVVNQGDWVAVTYYNEGLQSHPMHLHQFPQLVTAEDGFPLPQPYWVDTLLVAPGQRFTVMFHADKKGTWAYHCHILNHVERDSGMFGMVTAVIVK
jgi:FtsP/CotA-like multicopper oxidase with cupredoxin domain